MPEAALLWETASIVETGAQFEGVVFGPSNAAIRTAVRLPETAQYRG